MSEKVKYDVLILSDDYDEYLIKEGVYQDSINYHEDKPFLQLHFKDKLDFVNIFDYDVVVFDFGIMGDWTLMQMKELYKHPHLLVTSAMPESYIRREDCNLPYVDFGVQLMYIDLIHYIEKELIKEMSGKK